MQRYTWCMINVSVNDKVDCDSSLSQQQRKKNESQFFLTDHTCPPPNTLPHHSFSLLFLSLWPVLTSPHFSFLSFSSFFISIWHFSSLPHPLPRYSLRINISTTIFLARSPENSCEPINTFTSFFFEVKIYNLFCGFYTFAWGYFYLSFNNDTHVIYEHWK